MATLIYTIAQNGFDAAFSKCISSQKAYAERIGAQFVSIDRPWRVADPALSAWLKVPVLLGGLEAGYDWVAYIDADCAVAADAPDFREEFATVQNPIMMGNGRSGRLNSGVMFARQDPRAIAFFRQVLDSLTEDIPEADRANLKYENGNIIYCASTFDGIEVLGPEWNNSLDEHAPDHIRHYTGAMRATYDRPFFDELRFKLARRFSKPPRRQPASRDSAFVSELDELTARCASTFPALVNS